MVVASGGPGCSGHTSSFSFCRLSAAISPISVRPTEVDQVDQEWSAVHTITPHSCEANFSCCAANSFTPSANDQQRLTKWTRSGPLCTQSPRTLVRQTSPAVLQTPSLPLQTTTSWGRIRRKDFFL